MEPNRPELVAELCEYLHSLSRIVGAQVRDSAAVEDIIQDACADVIAAVPKTQPQFPRAYADRILKRKIYNWIRARQRDRVPARDADEQEPPRPEIDPIDPGPNPERQAIDHERDAILERALTEMPASRGLEIIRRRIDGETREAIVADMRLTDTQYRLAQSRAKVRVIEIARKIARIPKAA